jgi:hypothetical protein
MNKLWKELVVHTVLQVRSSIYSEASRNLRVSVSPTPLLYSVGRQTQGGSYKNT